MYPTTRKNRGIAEFWAYGSLRASSARGSFQIARHINACRSPKGFEGLGFSVQGDIIKQNRNIVTDHFEGSLAGIKTRNHPRQGFRVSAGKSGALNP